MSCRCCEGRCSNCHRDFDFEEVERAAMAREFDNEPWVPETGTVIAWTIREALAREGFIKKYRESNPDMHWEERPVSPLSCCYPGVTQEDFHNAAAQAAVGIVEAMRGLDLTLPEIIRVLDKAHRALKENHRDRL